MYYRCRRDANRRRNRNPDDLSIERQAEFFTDPCDVAVAIVTSYGPDEKTRLSVRVERVY